MGLTWRKSKTFGLPWLHLRVNASRKGVSWTVKIGPWSWNTRQRRHRVDLPGPFAWQSRRRPRKTGSSG
jgi:hypothetical protein